MILCRESEKRPTEALEAGILGSGASTPEWGHGLWVGRAHLFDLIDSSPWGAGTARVRPKQGPLKFRTRAQVVGQECMKEISI